MTAALSVKDLTKIYANGQVALKGIGLTVNKGDFFGLLGQNGAGKSTAIGIICSLIKKTTGTVSIFGHDLDTAGPIAKSLIGMVPQEINFNIFETLSQILLNQAGYYGIGRKIAKERMEYYLHAMGLWPMRNQPAMHLSGGMKRRLLIARALMSHPELLMLDEPTAGVDIELRHSLWEFLSELNRQGMTIILTTHYLEEIEQLCKHIAILDGGQIIKYTNVKSFIGEMAVQSIVLDVAQPLPIPLQLPQYQYCIIDQTTLEVAIYQEQSINELFRLLTMQQIQVVSLRNKTNRLEELFLNIIQKNRHE